MNESFPDPNTEQLSGPIAESMASLEASEVSLALSYGAWLNAGSEESYLDQEAARNESARSFSVVVELVLTEPDIEFGEKMTWLRTVYNELVELRGDRLIELVPELNPISIVSQHNLQSFLEGYLKDETPEDAARFINEKYKYEMHNCLAVIKAAKDKKPPNYLKQGTYLLNTKQDYQPMPNQKRIGGVAIAIFGLWSAYLMSYKFKNR